MDLVDDMTENDGDAGRLSHMPRRCLYVRRQT